MQERPSKPCCGDRVAKSSQPAFAEAGSHVENARTTSSDTEIDNPGLLERAPEHDVSEASLKTCSQPNDSRRVSKSNGRKGRRLALCILFAGLILAISSVLLPIDQEDSQQQERFIELSFAEIVSEVLPIPVECVLDGANNGLKLRLSQLASVFPFNNRIFVVVNGESVLFEKTTGTIRETVQASLRFSMAFSVSRYGTLVLGNACLDGLSVYSDNPDSEAIRERNEFRVWDEFAGCITSWEHPIDSIGFTPRQEVQLEKDGLFVFSEVSGQ